MTAVVNEEDIRRLVIINGGNKFELFQQLLNMGLKDDDGKTVNRPHFRIEISGKPMGNRGIVNVQLWITGISAEDGSGDSWIIEGDFSERTYSGYIGPFQGLYNTRTRHGFIEVAVGH